MFSLSHEPRAIALKLNLGQQTNLASRVMCDLMPFSPDLGFDFPPCALHCQDRDGRAMPLQSFLNLFC
jgi:hypothetical protein